MIKKIKILSLNTGVFLGATLSLLTLSSQAEDYYINNNGSDSFDGLTTQSAFKSLAKVNELSLKAGDNIYLAAGQTFIGTLKIANEAGTEQQPITVSNYAENSGDTSVHAIIDAKNELAGIDIVNASYVNISNIEIHANGGTKQKYRTDLANGGEGMRVGVLIDVDKQYGKEFGHITLDNLIIHDIYYYEEGEIDRGDDVNTQNGTQAYGWGIRAYNRYNGDVTKLTDITVKNSEIYDVAHTGIKFTSSTGNLQKHILNVRLEDNYLHDIGGPGIQFSGVDGSYVARNVTDRTGSSTDSRKWGRGSGMWTWTTNDVLVEHNTFKNAVGPADSAGFHIDFNCSNIIIQYNLSINNEGAFIEILGNNENNTYRYNVSINDGYRVKGTTDNPYGKATHDGKTLWFSGFVGMKGNVVNPNIAPKNNYIYNNTIYVSEHIAQLAMHNETDGAVIANNIFYFKKGSRGLAESRYQLVDGVNTTKDMQMSNNLFLTAADWPLTHLMENTSPITGDANFVNAGGLTIQDYIAKSSGVIEGKGIEITKLPQDQHGISSVFNADEIQGLTVQTDILGNTINGNGHIGAIYAVADTNKSTATLTAIASETTSQSSLLITVDFDTDVSGLSLDDFTVINGALSDLTKSSETQWTFTLMPDQYGLTTVKLNADSVVDNDKNGNFAVQFSITFEQAVVESDTKDPVATISGPTGSDTTQANFNLTIDFDEAVVNFELLDLIPLNATLNDFTKNNDSQWTVAVKATTYGDVAITLPENSAFDAAANGNAETVYSIHYKAIASQPVVEPKSKSGGSLSFYSIFLLMFLLGFNKCFINRSIKWIQQKTS